VLEKAAAPLRLMIDEELHSVFAAQAVPAISEVEEKSMWNTVPLI